MNLSDERQLEYLFLEGFIQSEGTNPMEEDMVFFLQNVTLHQPWVYKHLENKEITISNLESERSITIAFQIFKFLCYAYER